MNIAKQWEHLRVDKGVSWVSIAKEMQVDRRTLYSMVNSKNPTLSTITALAKAFDVKASDVINKTGN